MTHPEPGRGPGAPAAGDWGAHARSPNVSLTHRAGRREEGGLRGRPGPPGADKIGRRSRDAPSSRLRLTDDHRIILLWPRGCHGDGGASSIPALIGGESGGRTDVLGGDGACPLGGCPVSSYLPVLAVAGSREAPTVATPEMLVGANSSTRPESKQTVVAEAKPQESHGGHAGAVPICSS